MKSVITATWIFDQISVHLANRDDFWHIVNGPKRETWFTAETIAALSRSGSGSLNYGLRVYGEESYSEIAPILGEHKIPFTTPIPKADRRRIPDVSILEAPCSNSPCFTIAEAKLVSPNSTKTDKELKITSDVDKQLKALASTAKKDGLLDQLNRARQLVPAAQVYGLVFAVHRLGQCEQVQPNIFFANLAPKVEEVFEKTAWKLWDQGIRSVPNLQSVQPLGGMFNGQASLGIGIVIAAKS